MFFEVIKSIFLGIIEGITEWLPVSSTGHLILFNEFWPLNVGNDVHPDFQAEFLSFFEVAIQLGAILAVIILFFNKLWPFGSKKSTVEKKATWSMWFKICVASVPAFLIGVVFDKILEKISGKDIEDYLYNGFVVAFALIVYGILFIVIEKKHQNTVPAVKSVNGITYKTAFLLGVFQMLALIPGTSRSGSTILGAILIGLSRECAAEFTFFMAIPAMAGGSFIKGISFIKYLSDNSITLPLDATVVLLVSFFVAFAVSMVIIKFLMNFVRKHSFAPFGVYRIILGTIVLLYFGIKAML